MKKSNYKLSGILLSGVVIASSCANSGGDKNVDLKQPNIIFLLTDDQAYNTLGVMGNDEVTTPNIDKLANQSVIFDNYYNTTAISMASRANIMTGMYEFKSGCNFQHGPLTSEKFQLSYPILLREAGYRIGFAGKFGFAVTESSESNSSYHTYDRLPVDEFDWWKGWPGQGYYQTEKNKYMVEYAEEYPHVSTALGAAAKDFLRESASSEQPFCLSVSFKAPHSPVSPNKDFNHIYEGAEFTKPVNYGEKGAAHLPEQSKQGRQYTKLRDRYFPEKYDEAMAKYHQLIYGVDVAVGMIMDELKVLGLDENTIVIFTSDNGYFTGAHDFGGKVLPYEEGARAPLIIYTPGRNETGKALRTNALAGNIDIAPTILEYTGLSIPENMDGVSLIPVVDDPTTSVKDNQLFVQAWGETPAQSLSLIHKDYKYLYWFYGEGMEPAEELYNLDEDPYEMNNLFADPSEKSMLDEIRSVYDSYIEKWVAECVPGNNYPVYGEIFDRNISWDNKKQFVKYRGDK